MAPTSRHGDTRNRIIDAAAHLARTQGRAFSTRDVAHAIGVTQPSLFHHFKSKTDIVHALVERDLRVSLLRAQLVVGRHSDPIVVLYAYLRLEFHAAVISPTGSVLTHEHDILEEPGFEDLLALDQALHAGVEQMFAQAVAQDRIVAVDPDLARELISGVTMFLFNKANSDDETADRQSIAHTDLIVRGLLSDPGELARVQEEAMAVESNVRAAMLTLAED